MVAEEDQGISARFSFPFRGRKKQKSGRTNQLLRIEEELGDRDVFRGGIPGIIAVLLIIFFITEKKKAIARRYSILFS